MELRHLRYFVAVDDAGNLTVAAQRMLHTSQPSLSRQIRDLEDEVGARLLTRRARGIELTPAGRAFPEHARVVLSQVEAATSLRSSSCRFRGWTSWSLVSRRGQTKIGASATLAP